VQYFFSFAPDCGATAKQWLATKLLNQNKAADEQFMYTLMSIVYGSTPVSKYRHALVSHMCCSIVDTGTVSLKCNWQHY
jgi:hypothetical protein